MTVWVGADVLVNLLRLPLPPQPSIHHPPSPHVCFILLPVVFGSPKAVPWGWFSTQTGHPHSPGSTHTHHTLRPIKVKPPEAVSTDSMAWTHLDCGLHRDAEDCCPVLITIPQHLIYHPQQDAAGSRDALVMSTMNKLRPWLWVGEAAHLKHILLGD